MKQFLRKLLAFATAIAISSGAHAGLFQINTQIPATANIGSAYVPPVGFMGQQLTASVAAGSSVAITTSTATNITSISITPGNWLIYGQVIIQPAGTTTMTVMNGFISGTSASLPTYPNGAGAYNAYSSPAGAAWVANIGPTLVAATTTFSVFLECYSTFAVSTNACYGNIVAIRLY